MSLGADDLDLSRLSPEYRAAFEAQLARIAELAWNRPGFPRG